MLPQIYRRKMFLEREISFWLKELIKSSQSGSRCDRPLLKMTEICKKYSIDRVRKGHLGSIFKYLNFVKVIEIFTGSPYDQAMLPLQIQTPRTLARLPEPQDAELMLAFHLENQKHFEPWDPGLPDNFFKIDYWLKKIEDAQKEFTLDQSLRLNIFHLPTGKLIGTSNYTSFERGPFQNCRLGYKIAHEFQGQGLMRESLRASLEFVFLELKMHRVEANFIPRNDRSGALLKRLGFTVHGIAPQYLRINGRWEDHALASLLAQDLN